MPHAKTRLAGGAGGLGLATVIVMHKAVHIAEKARHKPDKDAHERAMIWVDNLRKGAVPNSTLRKYFPNTYDIWLPSGEIRNRHEELRAARGLGR